MPRLRIIAALILFSLSSLPASAAQDTPEMLETILQRGTLRVGFDTFVPWAMTDKHGEYIGFEVDVARRLAKDIGVELELVPTKWSGIIPALLTGKFDVIIGGMGIQPARNLKVNFSIPYEYSGMSLVASKTLAPDHTLLEQFNKENIVLAVKTGATSVSAAKKYLPLASLRMFDDEAQALQEVLNGRAHAMIASAPFPEEQALRHPKKLYLPLKGETFTKEPIGFAIRKNDHNFLNFLNNWITLVDTEGWLNERHTYWFKTLDWESRLQ